MAHEEMTNYICRSLRCCDKVRFLRRVLRQSKPYSEVWPRFKAGFRPNPASRWKHNITYLCSLRAPLWCRCSRGSKPQRARVGASSTFLIAAVHINRQLGPFRRLHKLHNLTPHSGITLITGDPNHPHNPAVWCEHSLRRNQRWFTAVFQHHGQLPVAQCWVRSSP